MNLQDDDLAGGGPTHVLAQGVVLTKFCVFGLVTSKSWDLTYIVVTDSCVRLYDSEETFLDNPTNYVMVIQLTRKHDLTVRQRKNYGRTGDGSPFDVYTFYIETTNGIWSNSRIVKIGSPDKDVIDNLYSGIRRAMI